jgi:hypothetical protein
MWTVAPQPDDTPELAPAPSAWYLVLGEVVAVVSGVDEALERVEETYAAFRADAGALGDALVVELRRFDSGGDYMVCDSGGYERRWPSVSSATVDLLSRIVHGVLARLQAREVYAIHAGAVVYRGAALILAGKSGQGKTTLVLGLLRRGFGLLSDEFAIVEPGAPHILPYRRSLHVRPGTPELIPELSFLYDRPRHQLGGGIEWAVTPADLDRAFPNCLAAPAPLRYVLLLDGVPRPEAAPAIASTPAALATIELLRGTWAASVDFAGGLERIARLMNGAVCGRLQVGAIDATTEAIASWLEERRG